MLAFVVEAFAFLLEMVFGAVVEVGVRFFFADFADAGAGRKPEKRASDEWAVPRIVGLAVFFSLLITGLWLSYLRP